MDFFTPSDIDFSSRKNQIGQIISELENLQELTKSEIEGLKGKVLSEAEKKNLSNLKIDLGYVENDIEIKKQLLKEYTRRSLEYKEIEQSEEKYYKENFKNDLDKAYELKSNLKLPCFNRSRLSKFLKEWRHSNKKYGQKQKVSFCISLKVELGICKNILKNIS
jgi:hypothetical protein